IHEARFRLVREARVMKPGKNRVGTLAGERPLAADHRATSVWVVERESPGEVTSHRATHVDRTVETELPGQRDDELHEEVLGERVFALPPFAGRWRQRLPVIREVVSDQTEAPGNLPVLEEMPPLAPVGARGVLKDHRDPGARLLEV